MSDLLIEPQSVEADAQPAKQPQRGLDWSQVVASPAFWPGVALLLGFVLVYFKLVTSLWGLWTSVDGYYSHGFLVPAMSAYFIYRAWPRLSRLPVKPVFVAIVPVLLLSWIAIRAGSVGVNVIASACLIFSIMFSTAFVAGWRWMWSVTPATLYLAFAMPFWNASIDAYTNPLQKLSTKVAFQFLRLTNHSPYMSQTDDTTILLNNYTLNIAVPCSGLKLVLALTALVVFFVMIARLKWWGNAIMLASILPMALFFNGLRIALIGIVGDAYGEKAGLAFHDWSGYITLVVCMFTLFKFARALGWKD